MLFIATPTLTPDVDLEGRNDKTNYRTNNTLTVNKTQKCYSNEQRTKVSSVIIKAIY